METVKGGEEGGIDCRWNSTPIMVRMFIKDHDALGWERAADKVFCMLWARQSQNRSPHPVRAHVLRKWRNTVPTRLHAGALAYEQGFFLCTESE
jgi:hypothetical protein